MFHANQALSRGIQVSTGFFLFVFFFAQNAEDCDIGFDDLFPVAGPKNSRTWVQRKNHEASDLELMFGRCAKKLCEIRTAKKKNEIPKDAGEPLIFEPGYQRHFDLGMLVGYVRLFIFQGRILRQQQNRR